MVTEGLHRNNGKTYGRITEKTGSSEILFDTLNVYSGLSLQF